MKRVIFNQYVALVSDLYRISHEDFFKKSKVRTFTQARHMVYYLCATRPMRIRWIQEYMRDNGYQIDHSPIIQSVKSIRERVESDKDYASIIKKIEESCEI